jgi:hypothetical protein
MGAGEYAGWGLDDSELSLVLTPSAAAALATPCCAIASPGGPTP